MSVFRVEKNSNYTVMGNYHLRDMRLSLKAIGLLSKILSLPEDWDYSLKGLVKICKDGQSAVDTALHELEEQGYLERTRDRSSDGRLTGTIYTIYETPHKNLEKPDLEIPNHENHEQEKHDQDNHIQLSKDITNIKKEPNNDGTKDASLLASRAREKAVDDLVRSVVDQVGRPLSNLERRICVRWVEEDADPILIQLALEDNLYRDRFDLKYVDEALNSWKEREITNYRDAKNDILDNHVKNITIMASEIAERNYNDDLAESIVQKNSTADLQGTRDYIIELYQSRRYDSMISMIDITYHKDILDYLPQEIIEYYEEHKND